MSKPTDSLIRLDEVLRQTGGTKSQTYIDIKNGLHPEPIRRGRVSLWSQNEVNDYIDQLKAGARGVGDCNAKNRAMQASTSAAA